MIRAIKKGTVAKFTDGIWRTGIPQKAGWVPLDEEKQEKVIPKEIIDMSMSQAATLPSQEPPVVKKNDVAEKSELPKTVAGMKKLLDDRGIDYGDTKNYRKLVSIYTNNDN